MYKLSTVFSLALGLASAANSASAHRGCGGHDDIVRRNPGGPTVHNAHELRSLQSRPKGLGLGRRAVTDEASAAESTDVDTECTGYSYAPVTSIESSFPSIWETASIVSGDTEATSLFATINSTLNSQFPNDLPRGTNNGDFSSVTYNSSDVDCWWTWQQCTTPAESTGLEADKTTVPEPMTWGLSFDDGPNCSHNAFYDYLQNAGQKATMFYIGSNVMDWPLQALRGLEDGHHICIHTWSHQYMTSFTNEQAFAELYYTRKVIKDILGVTPLCWRPPYGDVDNRIRSIASQLNLTTYVWADDTDDWKAGVDGVTVADVTANYQAIIDKASNGTYVSSGPMVLTHEINNFTMSEFMSMHDSIKSAFKYIVPLASAFNLTNPYAETNVTYADFLTYTNQSDSSSSSSSASSTASGTSGSGSNAASVTASGSSSKTSSSSSSSSTSTTSAAGLTTYLGPNTAVLGLGMVAASFMLA